MAGLADSGALAGILGPSPLPSSASIRRPSYRYSYFYFYSYPRSFAARPGEASE
jgi:hypothetical protein